MGREHEDLVLVTGRLASGVTFSCNVDWISPTKIRRTRVLGERGMFEADTLTADLTLYRNGDRATAPWLQQQRGVTEGDMTRFAIAKPEPLGAELEAVLRDGRAARSRAVVTLEEGLETVRVAEAVLESARTGETVQALMRAVVVALGKIGLPLAVQIANAGHEVVGCDIDERVVELSAPGKRPVPQRARDRGGAADRGARTDTARPPSPAPTSWSLVPPLMVDARRRARTGARSTAPSPTSRAGVQAGHARSSSRRRVPVGTTRGSRRSAPRMPAGVHVAFSPERVSSGRVLRDLATYPKLVGGLDADGRGARGRALPLVHHRRRGLADGQRGGGRADEARRDDLPRREHRASPTSSRATPTRSGLDVAARHRRRQLAALQPHPPPRRRRRRPLHPGLPALLPRRRRRRARCRRVAREVNEAMPAYAVELLSDLLGGLDGTRVLILGVAYRGGVKETAFSGAFPLRDALLGRGAQVDGRPTRSTTTPSCARWASSRGTASPSRASSSRPTTASTRRSRSRPTGSSTAAASCATRGGVPLKRIGS